MGVLIKRPGDKLEISPVKFWGSIAVVTILLGLFAPVFNKMFVSKKSSAVSNAGVGFEEAFASVEAQSGSSGGKLGGNCPPILPSDSRLTTICGRVTTANMNSAGGYTTLHEPIENVSIWAYEYNSKYNSLTNKGKLDHPISSTSTNSNGEFRLRVRKSVPDGKVTIAYSCNGYVAWTTTINVKDNYPNLDAHIYCPFGSSLSYKLPSDELTVTSRNYGEGTNFQQCSFDPARVVGLEAPKGQKTETAYVYSSVPVGESNYDTRFVDPIMPLSFGREFTKGFRGAWRDVDCVLKADAAGYSSSGAPSENPCEDPMSLRCRQFMEEDTPKDSAEYVCDLGRIGSESMYRDDNSGTMKWEDYITRNAQWSLPAGDESELYRSFSVRTDEKQLNMSPSSINQYLDGTLGDVAWGVRAHTYESTVEPEPLPCELLRECTSTIRSGGTLRNVKTCFGPAATLSSPGTWQDIYYSGEPDFGKEVCEHNGRMIKLGEIQPSWDLCDMDVDSCPSESGYGYVLSKDYFWPIALFDDSGGYLGHSIEVEDDSGRSSFARSKKWSWNETALDSPYKTAAAVSVYEGDYKNNSPKVALGMLGVTNGRAPLTDIMRSPGSTDKEYLSSKTKSYVRTDRAPDSMSMCTIHSVELDEKRTITPETEGEAYLSNFFSGNEHHMTDMTPEWLTTASIRDGAKFGGSAVYYSGVAKERDEVLGGGATSNVTVANMMYRDFYDSLLTIASGNTEVDPGKITISGIWNAFKGAFSSGDRKSWGDRKDISGDVPLRVDKVKYPLNEENFNESFPQPTTFEPDDWGGSEYYPWHPMGVGEKCGTFKDDTVVSKTCRVDECKVRVNEHECYCSRMLEDSGGILCTKSHYYEDCGITDRRTCADEQETTGPFEGYPTVPPLVRLNVCNETYGGIYTVLNPYTLENRGLECVVSRAGPYVYAAPVTVGRNAEIKQKAPRGMPELEKTDKISSSAYMLAASLSSPGGTRPLTRAGGDVDLAVSNKSGDPAKDIFGYGVNVPGSGSISYIISPASSPTKRDVNAKFNPIYYHCNEFGVIYPGAVYPVTEDGVIPMGWSCTGDPGSQCIIPTEIGDAPSMGSTGGSCGMNTGNLSFNVPPTLETLIETAAVKYQVPAGVILGVMYSEGAFNPGNYDWTEENVNKWIKEGAMIPGCDVCAGSAQGPAQWRKSWWERTIKAMGGDFGGRVPNRCNLADQVFAMAFTFHHTNSGMEGIDSNSCYNGIPLNHGSGGAHACSAWDAADVLTADRMYVGYCDPSHQRNTLAIWNSTR